MLLEFQKSIGYSFTDHALLDEALTHPSMNKNNQGVFYNYQRLEFFGDKVLGLIASEYLMINFPNENEGDLSKRYAFVVSCDSLAQVALEIGIDQVIKLSNGEREGGGSLKKNNLENCLEAVIGAIYFDGGLDKCRDFILRNFANRLNQVVDSKPPIDPVSRLQEITQERVKSLPTLDIQRIDGTDHDPIFEARICVEGLGIDVKSQGTSKKEANKNACIEALKILGESNS